ncbi:MAG: PQQ-binding-like beta-propeller repeat protein, partial [Verrucomicrobiae bacterium]|nr:PQQ-binding-like beta-propeller repeat protein [Verrucomicrobiae bacterium]
MAPQLTQALKSAQNPPVHPGPIQAVCALLTLLLLFLLTSPAHAAGAPGTLRWQVPLKGPVATPAIGPDGTIYAGGAEELLALHPETGGVKWRGSASSTLSVLVGTNGQVFHLNQPTLSGISSETGGTLWALAIPTPERSAKIALSSEGNLVLLHRRFVDTPDWPYTELSLQSTTIYSTTGSIISGSNLSQNWSRIVGRFDWEGGGDWGAFEILIDGSQNQIYNYNWSQFYSSDGWGSSSQGSLLGGALLGTVSALGDHGLLHGSRNGQQYDEIERIYSYTQHFLLGSQIVNSDVDMSVFPDGEVPVVGHGVVYYAGAESIYAVDSNTARRLWSSSLDARRKRLALGDDGILYVSGNLQEADFGEFGRIVALSAATGAKRWEYRHPNPVTSAPMIAENGLLLVGASDGLIAVNSSSVGPAFSPWPLERQNIRNTANHGDGKFPPSCRVTSAKSVYNLGEDLSLLGNPYGPGVKAYQWYQNNSVLVGQTNASLSASSIGPTLRGVYRFEVVSEFGRASDSFEVRIIPEKTPLVLVAGSDVFEDGEFKAGSLVQLESGFSGGRVFYTLDGLTPRLDSAEFLEPFLLSSNIVVRALGVSADLSESAMLGPISIRVGNIPDPVRFEIATEVESGGSILLIPEGPEFLEGVEVSAAAIPNAGWRFLRWEGDLVGTEETGLLTMDSSKRVRAVFERIATPHTIQGSSVGNGVVYVAPREDAYQDGETVITRAVPAPRWRFVGWDGDLGGTAPSAAVLMDRSKSVIANFEPIPEYAVTVSSGGGSISGDGVYLEGEWATMTATPLPGWTFLGWSGDYSGSSPTITIQVTRPLSLVARFGTRVTVSSVGSGDLLLEPSGEIHPYGSRVKVIPRPAPGNYLGLWEPQWSSQSKIGWVLTVTNSNPSITGIFVPLESGRSTLLVDTVGGGTVEANPPRMAFEGTESVQLNAQPWPGWSFAGWSGDVEGVGTPVTLAMTGPRRVTATFALAVPGPTLAPIADRTIPELSLLAIALEPGHPDEPVEGLGLLLVEAPLGMSVGADRVLRWRPSEDQGPGVYRVRVRVVDAADLTTEQMFELTVTEVNSPPGIWISKTEEWSGDDLYLPAGQALSVLVYTWDSDLPAQSLTLDVVEGPSGLTVSPSGLVEWVPSSGHPRLTNEVVIRVTDDGEPPLSATTAFRVILLNTGAPPSIDGWTPLASPERFELISGAF